MARALQLIDSTLAFLGAEKIQDGIVIRPFRGWHPPQKWMSQVASPPYDVMDSTEARAMAKGNSMTFLHVNKAEIDLAPDVDVYSDTLYNKARDNLKMFIDKGYLVRDGKPCMYVYSQKMGQHLQFGLVIEASAKQYEEGRIKKHELTRKKKEDDRTKLTDTQSANAGPIFLTYRSRDSINAVVAKVASGKPFAKFTADDGVEHTLWIVNDTAVINGLQADFAKNVSDFYVADGHHRTASAWRVYQKRRAALEAKGGKWTGDEDFNHFLAVLFPDNQLKIMDYNRVVHTLNDMQPDQFLKKLDKDWNYEALNIAEQKEEKPVPKVLNVAGKADYRMFVNGKGWYKLTPKQHVLDSVKGDVIRVLDVAILSEYLLAPILTIKDLRKDERISFVGGIHGFLRLSNKVMKRGVGVAFGLYPTTVPELMAIADAGEIMPPKSTWFEPKLRSGVVVRTF